MSEKRSNLIDVGRIAGAFGVKGWLKVVSDTEPAENIVKYSPWWLKTRHGVKAFEVVDTKQNSNGLLVQLKGIDDRDRASEYKLTKIAVDISQLSELEAGDYYWHQLIGLDVISDYEGKEYYFGRVKEILETGANDVLVVDPESGPTKDSKESGQGEVQALSDSEEKIVSDTESKQRLIPYLPDLYVTSVNLQNKEIRVIWDPDF